MKSSKLAPLTFGSSTLGVLLGLSAFLLLPIIVISFLGYSEEFQEQENERIRIKENFNKQTQALQNGQGILSMIDIETAFSKCAQIDVERDASGSIDCVAILFDFIENKDQTIELWDRNFLEFDGKGIFFRIRKMERSEIKRPLYVEKNLFYYFSKPLEKFFIFRPIIKKFRNYRNTI